MADREQVRQQMSQDGIEFILAQFVDIHGSAKVKMTPASSLDDMIDDGAGFAGAAVWGAGQGPHSHDMLARIDLDSYTPLPWMPNTARFAADLFVDGQSYPFCPRTNLKRVLQSVRDKGYVFNVGMEPEHFLVTRNEDGSISPWDPDNVDGLAKPCYDFRSMAPAMGYLQDLTSSLNQLGWGVYQTDHEDANGQYEVNFDYQDALTTADRITFFKMATSQIAKRHGAIATHMAKPFRDRTGSGLHVHFHLADADSGKCMFDAESDDRGLGCSQLGYHFVGGVLHHARALCAVTSPTVNCYKRLQLGEGLYSSRSGYTWTPAFITYGDNNRTQMIRTAGPGHFEDRTVSAGCNPYLALAAYVAAGMDGIEKQIDPGDPNLGNMYERSLAEVREQGIEILPQSLPEAIDELRRDEVVKGALGVIADDFIALKMSEWSSYDRQVTAWEVDQYLTFF
ncbi:MAG: type III glutamate--ammonia ligase [Pirellulaceae bacterium]|jgi:glutamine synthetase|nr:type III glutamate--ammonia ligase [Pirellulaceae bacterium]MDP7017040.1 type III glutamate--ammonia ligase [Pirellulaceae bacterium]